MLSEELVIGQTRKWIWEVVIGLGFCPFASREMQRNTVRYATVGIDQPETGMEAFEKECRYLDTHQDTATTLIIFPHDYANFMDFLDLIESAEDWIIEAGLEGIYQVASFHPQYIFAGAPADDPANYTNRSPYPMLHLLREDSLEQALAHYPGDPEAIPDRNIRVAHEKGLEAIRRLRDSCFILP